MRNFLPSQQKRDLVPNFAFLGGTVNGSTWRERLIPRLTTSYFNPVVQDWTIEDRAREEQAKAAAQVIVYCITPLQRGFYTWVELAVTALASTDKKIAIVVLNEDGGIKWDNHQADSITAIENLLATYSNVFVAYTLEELADFINSQSVSQ